MAALVNGSSVLAQRFVKSLSRAGAEVLNDVVLNQVLVSFGSDERTAEVIRRLREEGTAWFSGTRWRGREAMRMSVSCWSPTEEDIDVSANSVLNIAKSVGS